MWDDDVVDAIKAAEDPWEKSRKYWQRPVPEPEDKELPIETIILAPYRAFCWLLTGDRIL